MYAVIRTQFELFASASCGRLQDEHNSGISDRPEHIFGIAALSLMGYKGLEPIALPVKVMQQICWHQKQ